MNVKSKFLIFYEYAIDTDVFHLNQRRNLELNFGKNPSYRRK